MTSDAAFAPVDPRGTVLGDEVYRILGEAIIDGRLSPGERVRDVEMAERLGVSRTPVREALQRLERCGLVEVAANRWTRVTVPDEHLVAATHEFVVYLIGNAIRMALRRGDDRALDPVLAGVDDLTAASAADDDVELRRASMQFFMTVTRAAGNRALQSMFDEREFAMRRTVLAWHPHLTDVAERTDMYRVLRDAIAGRDGDAAERILRMQHGLG